MNKIFADTSFYLALLSKDDDAHNTAYRFIEEYSGGMVTSQYVIIETANHVSARRLRNIFTPFYQGLVTHQATMVVPAEARWFEAGINLYIERPDKNWSLTDCISFEMMREFNITSALTTAHHFQQAGFTALLLN
jgi:uncharacterized protein